MKDECIVDLYARQTLRLWQKTKMKFYHVAHFYAPRRGLYIYRGISKSIETKKNTYIRPADRTKLRSDLKFRWTLELLPFSGSVLLPLDL